MMGGEGRVYSPIEDRWMTWDEVRWIREERGKEREKLRVYRAILLKVKDVVERMEGNIKNDIKI